MSRHRTVLGLAIGLGLTVLAGCGSDDADSASSEQTVAIGVRDYAFDGVPQTVAAGTRLTISNSSQGEAHELVAVKLDDAETRPASELITLPEAELGALIGADPAAVLVAPPGGVGFAAVGDGVLDEPGRYLLLCAIPLGADPTEYLAAAQTSQGPPQVDGGAPHFTAGMFAELVVDAGK